MLVRLLVSLFFIMPMSVHAAETVVEQDYHMSLYKDVQGSIDAFELYSKVADKGAFIGITCSMQSPLPLMQVILFEEEVMSESPKLLQVKLKVDNKTAFENLNGVLKVVDTVNEFSNKVRVELATKRGTSFLDLQQGYMRILNGLQNGEQLTVELSHRTLESKTYEFSLKGLKTLLSDKQKVCF